MRLVLALSILLSASAASPALARPYTVEDLLSLESLGAVQIDPTERWLVIEHRRPWRSAARYDYNYKTNSLLSELKVVDLQRPGPAKPLFAQGPSAGYTAGPISPDGVHMLVYRLEGHSFEAGLVTLASGQVRWMGITPELPVYGRAAQWRSARELVLIARANGDLPRQLAISSEAQARLPQLWAATAQGKVASRTRIGSGRFLAERPAARPSRLLKIDAQSGAVSTLATGEFIDLEVSRSGRFAALITNREEAQPTAQDAIHVSFPTRRRSLDLVDLATGRLSEPSPGADVALGLMTWSQAADRLLVAMREATPTGEARILTEIDAPADRAHRLDLASLVPELSRNREGSTYLRADWLGDHPILFARSPTGRADWYALAGPSPRNLTHALKAPLRALAAIAPDHLLLVADGALWRLDEGGGLLRLGAAEALAPEDSLALGGSRPRENPELPAAGASVRQGSDVLRYSAGNSRRLVAGLTADQDLLATSRQHVVVLTRRPEGTRQLDLALASGPSVRLLQLNRQMAEVTPAEVTPVAHTGPKGEPLTSWLYRPAGRAIGSRSPLVVIPYRGRTYPTPYRLFEPGEFNSFLNPQVLVGAGYAVLIPSLPYDEADGRPTEGLADEILKVVDAAVALGGLDPDRIALYGHSFGAVGAVAAASQSDRFKSVVAVAGLHDAISSWGIFPQHQWVVPEDGAPSVLTGGTVEGGQPHMRAPPWSDPERYIRASNLFVADKITAPVLIVHGEADEVRVVQSQELFSALYRQGKDAMLVTYWGEGHVFASPANIRDLYGTILDWLARTMPPRASAAPNPPAPPNAGPKPPPPRS